MSPKPPRAHDDQEAFKNLNPDQAKKLNQQREEEARNQKKKGEKANDTSTAANEQRAVKPPKNK